MIESIAFWLCVLNTVLIVGGALLARYIMSDDDQPSLQPGDERHD